VPVLHSTVYSIAGTATEDHARAAATVDVNFAGELCRK
jgi:hypothetical protein